MNEPCTVHVNGILEKKVQMTDILRRINIYCLKPYNKSVQKYSSAYICRKFYVNYMILAQRDVPTATAELLMILFV